MAAFNKFNCFVADLGLKQHDLNADTIRAILTNEQPLATDTVKGDMVELSAGNGYNAGGEDVGNAFAAGVMTGVDITWTASGAMGPFRFVVLYNDAQTTKRLIGWYDYGSSITPQAGETFKTDFGASILTIA